MANTDLNTGATYTRPVHGNTGGTAAAAHRTDDSKPQTSTIMWVVAAVIVLAAIIWGVSRATGGSDNNQMDRRSTEQVSPAPGRN